MKLHEDKAIIAITVLSALLIATHGTNALGFGGIIGSYLYWLIRVSVEVAFFFGVFTLIKKYAANSLSDLLMFGLAVLISHIPFVLTVTALDIVLGFPELGLDSAALVDQSRFSAFALELLYLLDNHIIICLLVSLPGFYLSTLEVNSKNQPAAGPTTFLSTIDPPLKGTLLWVEAQEHYVRITTDLENRMVLARFSDIVRELEDQDGMQVHRSHWVARSAVVKQERVGQSVLLTLTTGDSVPVSRSFRNQLSELETLSTD